MGRNERRGRGSERSRKAPGASKARPLVRHARISVTACAHCFSSRPDAGDEPALVRDRQDACRRRPRIEQLPAGDRPRRRRPDLPPGHLARNAALRRRASTSDGRIKPAAMKARARLSRALPRAAVGRPSVGGARGRNQRFSRRDERARVPAPSRARAGLPDRRHQRPRRGAADLSRRRPRAAAIGRAAPGRRHRRRIDRIHHRPRTRARAPRIAENRAASA